MTRAESASFDADVVIIGYGPVGATAANLLGQAGVRTIVLERDADIYSRSRAISTDEEIIRIWQRVGLADIVKADMLGDRPIDFVGADGRSFMNFALAPRGHGHPTQMFIYQPALEGSLRQGVERFDCVTVMLGHESTGTTQDAEGVTLEVRNGQDGSVSRIRCRFVIAADGGSSPTRTGLGIPFSGRTFEDKWIVIDTAVKREWPEVDRLRFHCDPKRPSVDCPTPLGHHRWEFPVLPDDDPDALVEFAAVRKLLAAQGITEEHVDVLRAVVYSHHVRFAARWREGRIFLAGDAAHAMPPWIGEGMASGVRDAMNLSWKIAAVLRGELPSTMLDTYEIERQPNVRYLTFAAVAFGSLITVRNRFICAIRNPLTRVLMAVPPVGNYIRDGRWFPEAVYKRGFFAAPARRSRRRRAEGWLLPQPWVLDATGRRVLLDDALPDGWTVLRLNGRTRGLDLEPWSAAGAATTTVLPRGSAPAHDCIVDDDGVLAAWFDVRRIDGVALRPDGVVFTSHSAGRPFAAPPMAASPAQTGSRVRL